MRTLKRDIYSYWALLYFPDNTIDAIFSEQGYHTFFNNYRATIKRLGFWKILLSLLMPFKVVEENCSSIQFLSHYNAIDDIVSCRIHAHPIMANRYPKAIFFIGIIGKKIDSIHYGMSVKLALAHMHICTHVHTLAHTYAYTGTCTAIHSNNVGTFSVSIADTHTTCVLYASVIKIRLAKWHG